jgi:hypothetical protein
MKGEVYKIKVQLEKQICPVHGSQAHFYIFNQTLFYTACCTEFDTQLKKELATFRGKESTIDKGFLWDTFD